MGRNLPRQGFICGWGGRGLPEVVRGRGADLQFFQAVEQVGGFGGGQGAGVAMEKIGD